jgi:transposase IS66-like protein/transposase IS66 family protein
MKAVVYDFTETRSGKNAEAFLGAWRGRLVCDDYSVMSLIQSAKLNGHDPYVYLKDVFARLPTQPASRIEELLPHRWQPTGGV